MRISVLIIAIWLQTSACRRLTDSMDNDLSATSNEVPFGRVSKDWVKITSVSIPVISRPVGARIEIECEAFGSPAPVVQWLKGNTPLTEVRSQHDQSSKTFFTF